MGRPDSNIRSALSVAPLRSFAVCLPDLFEAGIIAEFPAISRRMKKLRLRAFESTGAQYSSFAKACQPFKACKIVVYGHGFSLFVAAARAT